MSTPSPIKPISTAVCLCATLWLLIPCATWAQNIETADPDPNTAQSFETHSITRTKHWVRSSVEWLASGFDSLFGDTPFAEGGKVTHGEMGLRLYKREDESASLGVRFRARFHLPNLSSYQYVFIGNDDRKDIVSDQLDVFSRQQQLLRNEKRDNIFFAGIGATVLENLDARLGFRGGLKPYAQIRYKHLWQINSQDKIEFRETIFYSRDDRFGSTTSLSYEHSWSPTLTTRWLSSMTATQSEKNAEWSNNFGTYKHFGQQKTLAVEALVNGVIGDPVKVADYGLQTKWTQPIYGKQLLGEFIVGHFWPRNDPNQARDRAWAVGTSISLKF